MAAKAGKKGKKGKTMALTDFLSDDQGNVAGPGTSYVLANKSVDWAQEMEELDTADVDPAYSLSNVDRTKLPTAPKAARILDDLEKVPTEPPFTAFIGNLPYEVSDEKIKDFFKNLPVVNIRLPEENGRFRGFGYVQFDTRQALIDALSRNEEALAGRKIRVDLAGQSQHGGDRKDGRGGRDDGAPDRTEGDWRRPDAQEDSRGPSRGFGDRGDRGPSRGFDDRRGGGGFDDRRGGGGFDDRRGGGGFDDRRGGGGFDDRRGGGGFDDRRGGGGFDDRRGGGGFDDRRGGGFGDRDGGRRGFGSGFRDGDRRGGGFDDRGGSYGRDSDRTERNWERGPVGDRSYERDNRPSYNRSERHDSREPEAPKERPRLQLQPRSKPVEGTDAQKESKSSIFGGAKPIDTARREREIEERLQKERETAPPPRSQESRSYGSSRGYEDSRDRSSRGYEDSKDRSSRGYEDSKDRSSRGYEESRDRSSRGYEDSRDRKYEHDNKENREVQRPERGSRKKSESSDHEGERRRHSSSSSSKGKKGSRGRRESEESGGGHSDVFSGGEEGKEDKSHNAVSPTFREDPQSFVPAPPPKQNIWEVRKTTHTSPPQQKTTAPSSPPPQESKSAPQTNSRNNSESSGTSETVNYQSEQLDKHNVSHSNVNHSDGQKKDIVPAGPPAENPWTRRKQEREQQTPTKPSQPSYESSAPRSGAPNAWSGRGRGGGERGRGGRGGFGRGRGSEPPKRSERKEKPLPNSIDEMPKMENNAPVDFSDGNKFAGLLDDED